MATGRTFGQEGRGLFTDSLLMAPRKASKPMVTWVPLLPLPGDEIWTKPSNLAKTRMPASHTFTLSTVNHDADVEGLCHVLLLPMDALKQTAPCLQSAACPGVSQLHQTIATAGHVGHVSMGSAAAGQPALTPDPLSRPGQFRGRRWSRKLVSQDRSLPILLFKAPSSSSVKM